MFVVEVGAGGRGVDVVACVSCCRWISRCCLYSLLLVFVIDGVVGGVNIVVCFVCVVAGCVVSVCCCCLCVVVDVGGGVDVHVVVCVCCCCICCSCWLLLMFAFGVGVVAAGGVLVLMRVFVAVGVCC